MIGWFVGLLVIQAAAVVLTWWMVLQARSAEEGAIAALTKAEQVARQALGQAAPECRYPAPIREEWQKPGGTDPYRARLEKERGRGGD